MGRSPSGRSPATKPAAEAELQRAIDVAGAAGAEPPRGEVYLVGAGPGRRGSADFPRAEADAEGRRRALRPARDRSILGLAAGARPSASMSASSADHHAVPQDEIGALLIGSPSEGKRVLRLKGGDPFLFGRGGEEIEALAGAGRAVRGLPGRDRGDRLRGLRRHSADPSRPRAGLRFRHRPGPAGRLELDWPALMRPRPDGGDLYGAAEHRGADARIHRPGRRSRIAGGDRRQRHAAETSAWCRRARERSRRRRRAAQLHGPTIIIIGSVVTLRQKLDWRARASLAFWLFRPQARRISDNGFP